MREGPQHSRIEPCLCDGLRLIGWWTALGTCSPSLSRVLPRGSLSVGERPGTREVLRSQKQTPRRAGTWRWVFYVWESITGRVSGMTSLGVSADDADRVFAEGRWSASLIAADRSGNA